MNVKIPKSAVTENYTLPSRGILYGKDFPSEVTIRSMTTFEEKARLGNQGFYKTMCNMIDTVVTSPDNFDTKQMTLFDFYYLMYKMRTVSYGNIYNVSVTCPKCGKTTVCKVDLDKLEVTELPENFVEPFTIGPLPRSGDTLECRFLRVSDAITNDKKAQDILKKSPEYVGDPNYILTRCSQIVTINGEERLPYDIETYVEDMDAMDSAYFTQAYDKIVNEFGMNTDCFDVCSSCGEELEFGLPFSAEFFRPTFDI